MPFTRVVIGQGGRERAPRWHRQTAPPTPPGFPDPPATCEGKLESRYVGPAVPLQIYKPLKLIGGSWISEGSYAFGRATGGAKSPTAVQVLVYIHAVGTANMQGDGGSSCWHRQSGPHRKNVRGAVRRSRGGAIARIEIYMYSAIAARKE